LSEQLAGKVALISGAARGQGAAVARLFVREGAMVVLGDLLDTGMALAAGTLTVDSSGAAWSGPRRISFFSTDGALQGQTSVITVRATRIHLEPLA
jgi:NAD(P)-dependent dehydrogenase (short-subunit alcohol dehydrogenase family)